MTTKKRAKGNKQSVLVNLRHEEYKAVLDHRENNFVPHHRVGAALEQINGIEVALTFRSNLSCHRITD